ncbi:PREDICTED: LOW QUALITY PROTEIN: olfactory receptor 1009-like [Apaloderma vittatum]|uniref:LOW QUALITY PROTEIN: olfactory receptor 1009-like n=1 Tax=Apaloderma vittatum TaxID=57397 RepID=UPI0005212A8A|nr:PREDICTED: LOW QUALITY PROTEIN: olfactory receptor 1009-like [Apaloderma vittatum]
MAGGNHSRVAEFVLLGFTDLPELLFVFFSFAYVTTLSGNRGMIILIKTNSRLHVPMYFFLSHLSFLDICSSTSIVPKILLDLLAGRNIISFNGCLMQFFFFAVFGTMEAVLLAATAYDRYVAIREPLRYWTTMSHGTCVQLVVGSYAVGSLNALVHTSSLLHLSFCGPNLINHFYCEIPPLLLLSCSDTSLNDLLLAILVSYACILLIIWSVSSARGRRKAFSTCTSHFVAVALFYGSAAFLYFHPFSRHPEDQGKTTSIFYTAVTPMVNPFTYSLRNKGVRSILKEQGPLLRVFPQVPL